MNQQDLANLVAIRATHSLNAKSAILLRSTLHRYDTETVHYGSHQDGPGIKLIVALRCDTCRKMFRAEYQPYFGELVGTCYCGTVFTKRGSAAYSVHRLLREMHALATTPIRLDNTDVLFWKFPEGTLKVKTAIGNLQNICETKGAIQHALTLPHEHSKNHLPAWSKTLTLKACEAFKDFHTTSKLTSRNILLVRTSASAKELCAQRPVLTTANLNKAVTLPMLYVGNAAVRSHSSVWNAPVDWQRLQESSLRLLRAYKIHDLLMYFSPTMIALPPKHNEDATVWRQRVFLAAERGCYVVVPVPKNKYQAYAERLGISRTKCQASLKQLRELP